MSSSTSSSDTSMRAIYGRIMLAILLGMGLVVAIFRLVTWLNDASADTILARVMEARAELPRMIDEPHDLVMVYGSSMVQAGFSARVFDRELAERSVDNVKSFNFGFGGLNPLFQDYVARRIKEAFQERDRRLKLAVIEFNPFQTTTKRYNGAKPSIDSFVSMLASTPELWDVAMEDLKRGALLLNIRYLRGDISAQMTTHHFGGFLIPPGPRSDLDEDEEVLERRREIGEYLNNAFEEDYPDWSGAAWNYDWQGAGTIPSERSPETLQVFEEYYANLQTDKRLTDARLRRIHCCDIEELHFEETLVQAFIRMVKEFQQFSDQVDVVMLPRNTKWINYPPEARKRLDETIARIEAETGVTLKDWQELPIIDPTMFSDATHLARYLGDVPFTTWMAEHYSEVLR